MTAKLKVPCYRFLVEKALQDADDLLTAPMLAARAGVDARHTLVALHNLKYCRAVDFVEADRTLWWFATPDDDLRSVRLEERTAETRPRAPRRRRRPLKPATDL